MSSGYQRWAEHEQPFITPSPHMAWCADGCSPQCWISASHFVPAVLPFSCSALSSPWHIFIHPAQPHQDAQGWLKWKLCQEPLALCTVNHTRDFLSPPGLVPALLQISAAKSEPTSLINVKCRRKYLFFCWGSKDDSCTWNFCWF